MSEALQPPQDDLEIYVGNINGFNPVELPVNQGPAGFHAISFAALANHVYARQRPEDAILYIRSRDNVATRQKPAAKKAQSALPTAEPMPQDTEQYSFADDRVVVNLKTKELLVDEKPVHLPGKPFQLVGVLARQAGVVTSADYLAAQLWPDKTASTSGLFALIKTVRTGLGEELGDPNSGAVRNKRGFGYIAVKKLAA